MWDNSQWSVHRNQPPRIVDPAEDMSFQTETEATTFHEHSDTNRHFPRPPRTLLLSTQKLTLPLLTSFAVRQKCSRSCIHHSLSQAWGGWFPTPGELGAPSERTMIFTATHFQGTLLVALSIYCCTNVAGRATRCPQRVSDGAKEQQSRQY